MKLTRVLVLEDDLETLETIMRALSNLERSSGVEVGVTVMSEYIQVQNYVNMVSNSFDIVLLDRDCKLGGSFHILDLKKLEGSTVVGISSVPNYNDDLRKRGVSRIVGKDYENLKDFETRLTAELQSL